MRIPSYWRSKNQRYSLEGIHKVDQQAGVTLAHMSSSPEVIEQVKRNVLAIKKLEEKRSLQDKKDSLSLKNVRSKLVKEF